MITKSQAIAKLDALKAYSIAQNSQYSSQYTSLMQPVYALVNTYFGSMPEGMKKALGDYVFQTYCDLYNRNVVYSDPVDMGLPTDFPTGYNDIRQCFYQFASLMSVTNAQFYAAWVMGTPEGGTGGVTPTPEPVSNTYLDSWTTELTSAPQDDVSRINNVVEWCKNASDSTNLIYLLEDQGEVKSYKDSEEIAKIIYVDHGLLEVIQSRGYNIYVPTYLRTSTTSVKG